VGDDDVLGAAVVGQHVPQHRHIQRPGLQAGRVGPALLDGDVAEAGGGDQGGGRGDRLGVGVHRRHLPLRTDGGGERRQHRPWPAADVGDPRPRDDAGRLP
jgi:hypothetical protein